MSGTRVVMTSTCPPAGHAESDGIVVVVEVVTGVVVDVVVVVELEVVVGGAEVEVVVVLGAVEVVDVLLAEVVVVGLDDVVVEVVVLEVVDAADVLVAVDDVVEVGGVLLVVEDVEVVVVVLDRVSRPVSLIRPAMTCPATNLPFRVAPSVTCSVASRAQTRAPTSAAREMEKREPRLKMSRSSAGPICDADRIRTCPAQKPCAADSASSPEPRRVRRLQNT